MKEIILTMVVAGWLLFVSTNVNTQLGQIYLHFTWISLVLLIIGITIFDKKIHITFQKQPGGQFKAILFGLVGWIVLLIVSVIVLRFISPAQSNITSVLALMGATTPALATSKIANLLTFGIAVAFIETTLWARAMEFVADMLNIDISKRSIRLVLSSLMVLIVILSLAFVFFHLTAKGLTNIPGLTVVFVMMFVSLIMVSWFGETRQAVYLHIWANTIASYLILFAAGALSI